MRSPRETHGSFAESADPEDVMTVLREYHATLGPLVHQYEGTLDHFAGDGMMVFFNDPLPCEDPPWRAVQMADAMRRSMAGLTGRWRRYGHEIGFGVGIAVGTVTILAARLCAEAASGQILVSRRVCMAVEGMAEIEPMGEVTLKGFAQPVATFNVASLTERVSR